MKKRWIPLLFIVPIVYLSEPVFWAPIGNNIYNFLQAKRDVNPWTEVVVVQINQSTVEEVFDKPSFPLSNHVRKHAELTDIINRAGARKIFFDLELSENLISSSVSEFVKAIRNSGKVYLAMSTREIRQTTEKGESIVRHRHTTPHDSLVAASRGAFVTNVKIDSDGILRRYYPDGKIKKLGLKRLPEALANKQAESPFPIEFPSINQQIPMVDYADVLKKKANALDKLDDRIVLVGSIIEKSNDFIGVPQLQLINGIKSYQIPGVLALAAITENIVEGVPLRDMKGYEQLLFVLLFCLAVVSFMPSRNPVGAAFFLAGVLLIALSAAAFLHAGMGLVSRYGLLSGAILLCGLYSWVRLEIHTVKELYKEEAENQRVRTEMENARITQLAFLPSEIPEIPGLEIWGLNLSSKEVSGDYYDIIKREDSKSALLALGDVSGKGMPASLLMSNAQACLHSQLFQENFDILSAVNVLNRLIFENTDASKFITFFLAEIDLKSLKLRYIRAGHEIPFIISKDGTIRKLEEGGLALGMFGDAEYKISEVLLYKDDFLFTYTDGITEARNEEDEEFGEERLIDTIKELRDWNARAMSEEVISRICDFTGRERQADDVTFIAMKIIEKI